MSPLRTRSVTSVVRWQEMTWTNISRPTRREMQQLGQDYHFHQLALEDCLSKVQLPKIDDYREYLFIILHLPVLDQASGKTTATQAAVFLGKSFLVTVHAGVLKPLSDILRNCQQDNRFRGEYLGRDSNYLLYRIVDVLVDYCFPLLDRTLHDLDKIEDRVYDSKAPASREIAVLRRDIAALRRIIKLDQPVIGSLEPRVRRFSPFDMRPQFGDVNDRLDRLWNNLGECQETVDIFKDSDFLLRQHKSNKILTVLAIVFAITYPASVIGAFYGKNAAVPGGLFSGSWTAIGRYTTFAVVLVIVVVFVLTMVAMFRRRRWI